MTAGFDHFDGSHRETFAAALVLLCIEEDPTFRALFATLIRRQAGLSNTETLTDWGREESLDIGPEQPRRRSDLWLRFATGTVLVEIKTHNGWSLTSVAHQMADQRKSSLNHQRVHEAVLLAPGLLLRRLPASDCPKLSWQDFLRAVDTLENPSQVVRLACAHWSENVERDYGLPADFNALAFDAAAAHTGCLVAFLRAAIGRVGGKPDLKTVWFASPDGRPRQQRGWAWHGTAVPGRIPITGDVYFGVYTYSAAPPGEPLGTFLEAYRSGQDDVPIVSIPFSPPDLSSRSLDAVMERFAEAYAAATGPSGSQAQ